ncbi:hypothetical protein [Aquimarina sediminis]|uniref:hypothetical protein n=1 Tax=Aquimarina sediminis TaxID=2070536 RepID=UPI000CA06ED3|nr:hypothetical protein [Aquimarina sediminis]
MTKTIFKIILVSLFIYSCQKEKKQDPFEITHNRIGNLTNETQIRELDSIFANDSIVKREADDQFLSNTNEIEIYEKGGAKLLVIEAKEDDKPTSTIKSIQVIDPRYKTISGLSPGGTFKDIKDNYRISKISNTLSAAVIFVESLRAYFTIDKKGLSRDLQLTDTGIKIKESDIPNVSKIKNFWITWDDN